MPENLSREYGEVREKYVELFEENGAENLASTIETTTAQRLAKDDFISGLGTAYPDHKLKLEALQDEILELQEQGKEAYDSSEYFDSEGHFQPNLLAKDLEEDHDFAHIKDSGQLLVYSNGYYQENGEKIIKKECDRRLGDEVRRRRQEEVAAILKNRNLVRRSDFQPPSTKVNFNNCVFDFEEWQQYEHSPDYNFKHKLPVNWNPEAKDNDAVLEFIDEIVKDKEQAKTLQEMAGYAMVPNNGLEKAFMLIGQGSNGKSMLIDVLKELLGDNYSNKSVTALEEERFATHELYGALAVIDDDHTSQKIRTAKTFKSITGGSDITAEIKYGGHYNFRPFCTPVFACNELPRTNDTSTGFFRRWMLMEFPYEFTEDPEGEYEKERVPKLKLRNKLTQTEALESFAYWAMAAFKDVWRNGQFTFDQSIEDTKQKWREFSRPVMRFIEKYVRQGVTKTAAEQKSESQSSVGEYDYDYVRKDYLHEVISCYCEAKSQSPPSKKSLTRALNEADLYFGDSRVRTEPEDNRVRVYSGLKVMHDDTCPGVPTYYRTFHRRAHTRVEDSEITQDSGTPLIEESNQSVEVISESDSDDDDSSSSDDGGEGGGGPDGLAGEILHRALSDDIRTVSVNEAKHWVPDADEFEVQEALHSADCFKQQENAPGFRVDRSETDGGVSA